MNGFPKITIPEQEIPFQPRNYVCYQTPEAIVIDGKINDKIWEKAPWTEFFRDIEGDKKPEPLLKTRAKMLWDKDYLYFAAELEEPHVWANLTERESIIFYDNDFEIFIDPDGDTHQYYEFEMNAFATIWDLLLITPYRDGGPCVYGWDIRGIQVAVHVDGKINDPAVEDKGWTLEVAMPWEILKECAPNWKMPNPGDQWRINFSRVEWQTEINDGKYEKKINPETGKHYPEYNWVWSPQGVINMHCPETWGFVQFSSLNAGDGNEDFIYQKDEVIKWALRQIYYQEKLYFEKNQVYTADLNLLGALVKEIQIEGYKWAPTIEITSSMYEAKALGFDGKTVWHIRQDGKIWKTK